MEHRTLRVGLTAILFALVFRLCTQNLPHQPELLADQRESSIIETETGHNVRFSKVLQVFSPDFVESSPPTGICLINEELPVFSDTGSVELAYFSTKKPDIDGLLAQPLNWSLQGSEPTVLILHTHSTESYSKQDEDYQETVTWRTLDENYNMLSLGQLLQKELARRGICAVQDRECHDYPSYNGSYTHARKSMQSYLKEHPSIQLILDLHRDASEGRGGQLRTLAQAGNEASAQLMLVIGANHADYENNLSLALKLHAQLEVQTPGITRPIQLRASRFNQDLCPGALLVEVGAAGNTHQEAQAAVRELAKAIIALSKGTGDVEKHLQEAPA